MNIFALDTSTPTIGIAALCNGQTKMTRFVGKNPKASNSSLMDVIEETLKDADATLADFDCFAVNVGPGSFTGIRVGVATVNAFATAYQKPVVEIVSLEQKDDGSEKIVLLDCKHDNYYAGIFGNGTPDYREMKKAEAETLGLPIEFITDAEPERLLQKAIEKAQRGETVRKAKPFYLKKSSAETGIQ